MTNIKVTTWGPDTCTCRVQYQWDDDLPPDQQVHSLVSVLHRGDEHGAVLDDTIYSVLREESTRKNKALGVCAEHGLDVDAIAWVYSPGRTLVLTIQGLSTTAKQALNRDIVAAVGIGLVVIVP
jgi:hypothetical protein